MFLPKRRKELQMSVKSNLYRAAIISATVLFILFLNGCSQNEDVINVDLQKKEPIKTQTVKSSKQEPLSIAVGAMITPKEGFDYYRMLLDYVGEKLNMPIKFIDKDNYAEINSLLKTGYLDAAFVCSGPYVDGHSEFGLELLAMPVAHGETVYYSYILVHADSDIADFEGLRGKNFAFTDPQSNTGKLVPTYMLAKMNETPDSFFKRNIFTYAHDKSIRAVAQKVVDGASVDSLVWEYSNIVKPELTAQTKIIHKSPPYGIPPFVVRPGLDSEIKERLKDILLNMHKDERGREILKGMQIGSFVQGNDSAYDTVREMKEWLSSSENK